MNWISDDSLSMCLYRGEQERLVRKERERLRNRTPEQVEEEKYQLQFKMARDKILCMVYGMPYGYSLADELWIEEVIHELYGKKPDIDFLLNLDKNEIDKIRCGWIKRRKHGCYYQIMRF